MRAVDFQDIEPGGISALGRIGEGLDNAHDFVRGQRVWLMMARAGWLRCWSHDWPGGSGIIGPGIFLRTVGRGLAPGMGQLNRGDTAFSANVTRNSFPCHRLFIVPYSWAFMRDPPARFDGGGFRHHGTEPARREFAQVDEMKIAGDPVAGTISHHGREDDPVWQCNAADGHWREKQFGCLVHGS